MVLVFVVQDFSDLTVLALFVMDITINYVVDTELVVVMEIVPVILVIFL
jgi:hypothetical protein